MTVKQIVLNANGIDRLIDHQAVEIADWLWERDIHEINVLPVMNGCMYYAPTLLRRMTARCPGLKVRVVKMEDDWHDMLDAPLLMVDTIFDTGRTARNIHDWWWSVGRGNKDLYAFLIAKSRTPNVSHKWWIGARVPEKYVFGYGLDDAQGLRRELPYICWEE